MWLLLCAERNFRLSHSQCPLYTSSIIGLSLLNGRKQPEAVTKHALLAESTH